MGVEEEGKEGGAAASSGCKRVIYTDHPSNCTRAKLVIKREQESSVKSIVRPRGDRFERFVH